MHKIQYAKLAIIIVTPLINTIIQYAKFAVLLQLYYSDQEK